MSQVRLVLEGDAGRKPWPGRFCLISLESSRLQRRLLSSSPRCTPGRGTGRSRRPPPPVRSWVALGAGLGLLGLVSERAREGLIGLPPLSYSKSDLVLTGVQSLWSLPWRAAASLAAPHPVLRGCAFAGLLLAAALLAGASFRGGGGEGALAALAFSAGALLFGAWLYSAAIHTGLETPGPGRGLACEEQLSRRWDVSAAFETCTWLVNDNPRNDERRQGLGGVLGFLLLAAGGGAWMGARSQARAAGVVGSVGSRGCPRSPRAVFPPAGAGGPRLQHLGGALSAGDGENRPAPAAIQRSARRSRRARAAPSTSRRTRPKAPCCSCGGAAAPAAPVSRLPKMSRRSARAASARL